MSFPYRDYMYGLDKLSAYVDKRPVNINSDNHAEPLSPQTKFKPYPYSNSTSYDSNLNRIINTISIKHKYKNKRLSSIKRLANLNKQNQCNFVTRNNYALFTSSVHLECQRPLVGRYIYIQVDGRNNRWSRLFSAVFCEIQAYEVK